jgi:HlyD family secretion protein
MGEIFRAAALQRLSSPEQLDQAIAVTSARSWIALLGVAVLLVGAVVWGILGQVPSRVYGEGIILYRSGEVHPGVTEGRGRLVAKLVLPGTLVKKGEALAELQQRSLQHDINDARRNLDALERQRQLLAEAFQAEATERRDFTKSQQAALNQKIGVLQQRVTYLTSLLKAREAALQGGIVTSEHEAVIASQRRIDELEDERRTLIKRIQTEAAERERSMAKQRATLTEQVKVLQERVRNLKESLQRREELRSRGIVTPEQVAEYEERLHETQERIIEVEADREKLEFADLQAKYQADQQLTEKENELLAARNQLELAQTRENLNVKFDTPLASAAQDTRNQLMASNEEIAEANASIDQILLSASQADHDERQRLLSMDRDILSARHQLETLQDRWQRMRYVESPVTGVVQEYIEETGSILEEGQAVVSIAMLPDEALSEDSVHRLYDAVLFITSAEAKLVVPGMAAQVAPGTAKKEEFGTIVGTIKSVSDAPVSHRHITQLLQNDYLAQQFAQRGAPILVRVKLAHSNHTPSGFQWSAGKGPAFPVTSGTLCSASVTVRQQAPITLVIPFFKKLLKV